MDKKKFFKSLTTTYTIIGFLLIITSVVLILIPTSPYIWYRVNPRATQQEIVMLTEEISEKDTEEIATIFQEEREETQEEREEEKIPPLNTNLPEGYFVSIPSINVLSPISDNPNYEEALKDGTWIVPEFGTPEERELPIILAAHRFGYQTWTREVRERISFYNLPNVDPGEYVNIYWNQREYTFKIYKSEESTYISDYGADLILYTCKYFNSPIRIFRYATLVEL